MLERITEGHGRHGDLLSCRFVGRSFSEECFRELVEGSAPAGHGVMRRGAYRPVYPCPVAVR
jgi:hypothetical protein